MSRCRLHRVVYHRAYSVLQDYEAAVVLAIKFTRAIAVKVAAKRLPVSPFSGLLTGCKDHKTHRFENGGTNQTMNFTTHQDLY